MCLVGAAAVAEPLADFAYGQPNLFTSTALNSSVPADSRLFTPRGVAATAEGVYISDYDMNRILFFPAGSTEATRVYGQPDLTSSDPNHGGIGPGTLNHPWGLAANSLGLWVADWYNNRVLFYPAGSTVATQVYGQPDFVSSGYNMGGVSDHSLGLPEEVAVDAAGGTYVSDSGNSRVLYFPFGAAHASRIYGGSNGSLGPDHFLAPKGVAVDATGLYVTDYGNNRVLFFPTGSTTASRVYGQPNFYSGLPNASAIGPNTMQQPNGLCVQPEGLYVSDYLNSRIMFYPTGSQVAMAVYGQPDFTAVRLNNNGVTSEGFYVPWNVAVDSNYVYGADAYSSRVLRFPKNNAPVPAAITFTTPPVGGTVNAAFGTQPVVTVALADGTTASSFSSTVRVQLKLGIGPSYAKLLGTTSKNAAGGVASFNGLSIDTPGTYQLIARQGNLVAESAPFTITPSSSPTLTGDLNHDGVFDLRDVTLALRALAGLNTLN